MLTSLRPAAKGLACQICELEKVLFGVGDFLLFAHARRLINREMLLTPALVIRI
jgi:hypothetical protein